MRFFGQDIELAENTMNISKRKGPRNLLDFLPDIFTREEAHLLRQKMGLEKGNLKDMLSQWKKRGYIELHGEEMPQSELMRQRYRKTEWYLAKRKSANADN